MRHMEFERAVKRRILNRWDVVEYSMATFLFFGAACIALLAFLLFIELVERLGSVLL